MATIPPHLPERQGGVDFQNEQRDFIKSSSSKELHNKSVLEQVLGYLLDFFLFFFYDNASSY